MVPPQPTHLYPLSLQVKSGQISTGHGRYVSPSGVVVLFRFLVAACLLIQIMRFASSAVISARSSLAISK